VLTYGEIDADYQRRLAEWPAADDGPIHMLNLMKYREWADYGPGGEQGVTGREADRRYAPFSVLDRIGATMVLVAGVLDATEDWDAVAVVRYPTRRSFLEMQDREDFAQLHVHKVAGMDRTVIVGTTPLGALPQAAGRSRLLLELWPAGVLAPPSPSPDSSVDFAVEGTIVGGGRRWSTARYSRVADPILRRSSSDAQALLLRPFIEAWGATTMPAGPPSRAGG
jgi:hypothetical protein